MTDNTYNLPYAIPHIIGAKVAYNTTGIGTAATVAIGTIPAGSLVVEVGVDITTVFNAGTTNVLIVGTAANDDLFVDADDVNEAATGLTKVATGIGTLTTADTTVYVQYTQTGTAATTGAAHIYLAYLPPHCFRDKTA